jgi:hypothetical protein
MGKSMRALGGMFGAAKGAATAAGLGVGLAGKAAGLPAPGGDTLDSPDTQSGGFMGGMLGAMLARARAKRAGGANLVANKLGSPARPRPGGPPSSAPTGGGY